MNERELLHTITKDILTALIHKFPEKFTITLGGKTSIDTVGIGEKYREIFREIEERHKSLEHPQN